MTPYKARPLLNDQLLRATRCRGGGREAQGRQNRGGGRGRDGEDGKGRKRGHQRSNQRRGCYCPWWQLGFVRVRYERGICKDDGEWREKQESLQISPNFHMIFDFFIFKLRRLFSETSWCKI